MTALHLEDHGPARRFLEVKLDDVRLERTWGALERPASGHRVQTFKDTPEAALAYERQLARAEAKGYWAGRHNLGLIEAIARRLDFEDGYLVYGDWLMERGDPRGMLINSAPGALPTELEPHRRQFVPPLWDDWVHPVWWCGFARVIRIRVADTTWSVRTFPGRIRRVLAHPSTRFLRALAIEHEFAGSRNRWWEAQNAPFETYWANAFKMLSPSVNRIAVTPGPLLAFAQKHIEDRRVDELEEQGSSWVEREVRELPGS